MCFYRKSYLAMICIHRDLGSVLPGLLSGCDEVGSYSLAVVLNFFVPLASLVAEHRL